MLPRKGPVAPYERWEKIPGLEMVGPVHDEVIWLVPEEQADRAAGWLTESMKGIGDSVVNGDAPPEKRVPIEAGTNVCISWADKN